ncbi:MAG: restriction endonuclease subunit S [Sulfitobacter sp.]
MREGWKSVELGSFMEFKNGLNAEKDAYGSGIKFVNVMDVFRSSELRADEIIGSVQTSSKAASEYSVVHGDILFNRTSETAEDIACASVYLDDEPITFGGFVIRGRQTKKILDAEFCRYVFQTYEVRRETVRRCQGAVRANIGQQDLARVSLKIPPIKEQRKIAVILRTWEEALEKLNALRAAKARQLDGLAAKLIHDDQVERLHLRGFLKEKSTRNRDEQVQRVLSVTNSAGFVLAEEQFAHRVASASLSNYKIVRRGQYAYNPSRINVGSIARLDAWDEGALSPMYVVFQVQGGLDADFFGHWLRSAEARQRIALAAQGSVRETVSFGDLGSILVPVPTIERQQAIAKGLNAAQAEISLLDDEIKAVTRQKRGLMQKLLTGEWRVEVDTVEIPTNTKEAEHAGQ